MITREDQTAYIREAMTSLNEVEYANEMNDEEIKSHIKFAIERLTQALDLEDGAADSIILFLS